MYNGGIKMEKEIIFGSNEFALTTTNIESVIKNVIAYKDEKIWRWCISDTLGISMKGIKTKKFEELMKILETRTDATSIHLKDLLAVCPTYPESELVRHHRGEKKVKVEPVPVEPEQPSSEDVSKKSSKNARRRAARLAKRSLI